MYAQFLYVVEAGRLGQSALVRKSNRAVESVRQNRGLRTQKRARPRRWSSPLAGIVYQTRRSPSFRLSQAVKSQIASAW